MATDNKTAPPRPPVKQLILSPPGKTWLATVLALILMNGVGTYWAYQRWVVEAGQQRLNNLSQGYVDQQAAAIERQLQELQARLRNFARRESLDKALRDNNEDMRERFKNNLRQELSPQEIRTVRLIEEGATRLDRDPNIPIRFTEVDMINRAEKREHVFAEANNIEDEWRISLVQPIPFADAEQAEQPVSGVLLINLAVNELLASLNDGEPVPGRLELIQQYDYQDPQHLAYLGDTGNGDSYEAKIAGSYLILRFRPSAALVEQAQVNPAGLVAALAGIALASFALACLLVLTLGRRAKKAREAKTDAAKEHAASDQRHDDNESLDDFEQAIALVSARHAPAEHSRSPDTEAPGEEQDSAEPADPPDGGQAPGDDDGDVIPADIFRAYDIRGVVESQLTETNVVLIGQAIGSQALAAGETTLAVGRDGRTHSPDVAEQLIRGILSTGCNVVNIGMVPTPLLYYSCHELPATRSGVMVTASHNPPDYNGFKIVIAGETLKDGEIQALRERILQRRFDTGTGTEDFADLSFQYIDRIFSDVALAGELSVVIDAGNGVAGELAPRLFEELGCTVTPLFCEVDGTFPNHPPDPSVAANLAPLVEKVQAVGADLGIAFDGDADRVAVVTASGNIVPADRLLMMLARDIVARNPGADVLFDVKCSRQLNSVISAYGGRPIMWKSGHSHMKAKMKETGALVGGELSGHIFIKERWYGFDDGLYAAARVMEIMSLREQDLDNILENFPLLPSTPEIKIPVDDGEKFALVRRLIDEGDFGSNRITTIDGLRVDYPDGWGLVRASNTSAALTLRFEGEDEDALARVIAEFREQLVTIDPRLQFNV